MNDNQQIPSALKDYAQASGLSIDHNFLLTVSRYKINFFLSLVGIVLYISVGLLAQGLKPFHAIFPSVMVGFIILFSWAFFVWLRLLYSKSNNWFPLKNSNDKLEVNYGNIRSFQGKNLKIILLSWGLTILSLVSIVIFDLFASHLVPIAIFMVKVIYPLGMCCILLRAISRYLKQKTIMHMPAGN